MTQDEIIEMARQAGCPDVYTEWAKSDWASIKGLIVPMTLEQLVHCARLVAAKERESIIQIIKTTPFSNWFQADVIEAIRARGKA